MILRYGELVPEARRHMRVDPKMVLGVGEAEVDQIARHHAEFSAVFPYMELWAERRIATVEPDMARVDGRPRRGEPILASGTLNEVCAIDYGGLSASFVEQARRRPDAVRSHRPDAAEAGALPQGHLPRLSA
jgi:malate dehydrogenase (quinone)